MELMTGLQHEYLFDELEKIIRAFNCRISLMSLEQKILSTYGVYCMKYQRQCKNGNCEEEMIIEFTEGSCIIITFASSTYDLEFLPAETAFVKETRHETIKL
ncbi:hypothetical protein LI221_11830 [Faecalimonas umbilicata]|nr:hypothetical protein [Faecalimonas umbilicata]